MIKVTADPKRCGAGKGADCCAYLVYGAQGFECGREDASIKRAIDARVATMNAQRCPTVTFPDCQLPEES